jgi:hypothetical protein
MEAGFAIGGAVTLVGLLVAARRAWAVLLLGLVATAIAAYAIVAAPGVYWSRTDVFMVRPVSDVPNGLASTPQGTIRFAGLIQREIAGGSSDIDTVSDRVRIVDFGIRSGTLVRLPNDGNQYANNFNKALLDVQVAGPTEAVVRARMTDLIARINRVVAERQTAMGVPPEVQVRTRSSPTEVQVFHEVGSRKRALVATVGLGMSLTWAAVVLAEVRRVRRSATAGGPRTKGETR